MLSPKRTKYRKMHRGRLRGKACRNNKLNHGEYGIQALEPVWLTSRQIEAVRRTISRYTKRAGKIWIKVFPDKSVTARAEESRMGSGKGAVEYWVVVIKPGNVLFELAGVSKEIAVQALKTASYKLPIKSKILIKEENN
jgi:large subunit ribosomal protein L16|uniref:50S ribosomal protein L16 n=1 Tax=Ochromonas sp. CCMP1393 TaxID=420556 RepID=A0A0D3MK17_9STRA|nr:50S ribosomal protein L16 [Ochromonas sp. CCMP1393]